MRDEEMVAMRPELQGGALTRPLDLWTVLDLLRRGVLHPMTTPDRVRREPLPTTRQAAKVEIAYVEALLEGAFAGQLEAKLIVAYRTRLRALRRHLVGLPPGWCAYDVEAQDDALDLASGTGGWRASPPRSRARDGAPCSSRHS